MTIQELEHQLKTTYSEKRYRYIVGNSELKVEFKAPNFFKFKDKWKESLSNKWWIQKDYSMEAEQDWDPFRKNWEIDPDTDRPYKF